MSTVGTSRAERARATLEAEKRRIDALTKKGEREAGDVLEVIPDSAVLTESNSSKIAGSSIAEEEKTHEAEPTQSVPGQEQASSSARIALPDTQQRSSSEKKKPDRQGIDLRPVDRERVTRLEMFCLTNRLRIGRRRGLSLYARAGFQLLEELITTNKAEAEALLRRISAS